MKPCKKLNVYKFINTVVGIRMHTLDAQILSQTSYGIWLSSVHYFRLF